MQLEKERDKLRQDIEANQEVKDLRQQLEDARAELESMADADSKSKAIKNLKEKVAEFKNQVKAEQASHKKMDASLAANAQVLGDIRSTLITLAKTIASSILPRYGRIFNQYTLFVWKNYSRSQVCTEYF